MIISVVLIGRNSESLLKVKYSKDNNLLDFADEVIFVDSDSNDDTVLVAKSNGWTVIELSGSGRLSAAAGRNIGLLNATGDYVLFLDSDMTVSFDRAFIEGLIKKHIIEKESIIGIGGMTLNFFEKGSQQMVVKKRKDGEVIDSFGGFCLFNRDAILTVGNWNPNVIANEENELYARIKKQGMNVVLSREMICNHYTDNPPSLVSRLLLSYIPLTSKSYRIYGAPGFGLKAAIKSGSVFEYLYYFNSEVLLFLSLLIFNIVLCLLKIKPLYILFSILISLTLIVFWTNKKRKITFVSLLPTFMLQMVIGFFRYKNKEVIIKNK